MAQGAARAADRAGPILDAGFAHLAEHVSALACRRPHAVALDDGSRSIRYGALEASVRRATNALRGAGIQPGDRVAILAENRIEAIELVLATAHAGAILCALNWRFSPAELEHCIRLTSPALLFVSRRHAAALQGLDLAGARPIDLEQDYPALRDAADDSPTAVRIAPESGWIVLYTSGTTGFPKAALISHRAELARFSLSRIDGGLQEGDDFVAWAPLFHMVALEHALHVLALGGTVHVVDGADVDRIVHLAAKVRQWWLVLLPGMIDRFVETMRASGAPPAPIRVVGALADLVPRDLVAETSRVFRAPYWNTFGSTETGMLPFAGTRFAVGEAPGSIAKAPNSLHLFRLVDEADRDVRAGEPGEVAVRGATVFSGYWGAEDVDEREFRGGWFHMGDVFVERGDGLYDYVDRAKYLIKTGAENVYPAEIERVLLADPRVLEAVVVRRPDPKWGEVPVAFVACQGTSLTGQELIATCKAKLARYKAPREVRFVSGPDVFPRSTSGKIQRKAVEAWALEPGAGREAAR